MNRDTRLAQALVREAALRLPDPMFLGWNHFLNELNKFVNEHVRKQPGDPLTFVTLKGEPTKGSAILSIYTEDPEKWGFTPEKMVQAVKYFAGEMGIEVGREGVDPENPDSVLVVVKGLPTYEAPENHHNLRNLWMKKALASGEAVDVRMVGIETEPGVFRLDGFIDGVKYVDSQNEQSVHSIGKDLESGEILASLDDRFYQNPDYECIYLI
jgi:hypothetical protein